MADQEKALFVGDLHINCTESELETLFSTHGKVVDAKVMRRGGNDSRILSYGFVTFEEKDAAEIAQQALHGFMLGGRKLRVSWATFKDKAIPSPKELDVESTAPVHVNFIIHKNYQDIYTEEHLRNVFGLYGTILDVSIKVNTVDEKEQKRSGYGFVYFSFTAEGLFSAINASLNMSNIEKNEVQYKCTLSNKVQDVLKCFMNKERTKNYENIPMVYVDVELNKLWDLLKKHNKLDRLIQLLKPTETSNSKNIIKKSNNSYNNNNNSNNNNNNSSSNNNTQNKHPNNNNPNNHHHHHNNNNHNQYNCHNYNAYPNYNHNYLVDNNNNTKYHINSNISRPRRNIPSPKCFNNVLSSIHSIQSDNINRQQIHQHQLHQYPTMMTHSPMMGDCYLVAVSSPQTPPFIFSNPNHHFLGGHPHQHNMIAYDNSMNLGVGYASHNMNLVYSDSMSPMPMMGGDPYYHNNMHHRSGFYSPGTDNTTHSPSPLSPSSGYIPSSSPMMRNRNIDDDSSLPNMTYFQAKFSKSKTNSKQWKSREEA